MPNEQGWTPCKHYTNAIGWCPRCLKAADFDEPKTMSLLSSDREFVEICKTARAFDRALREDYWQSLLTYMKGKHAPST